MSPSRAGRFISRSHHWTILHLLVAAIFLGATGQARGADSPPITFTSPTFGYSIQLPAGWHKISGTQMRRLADRAIDQRTAEKLIWEAVYQKEQPRADGVPVYPYVICQVVRYPAGRHPTEAELAAEAATMTGSNVKPTLKKTGDQAIDAAMANASVGAPVYDPATHTVRSLLDLNVPGAGPIKAVVISHFGNEAAVSIMCYDSAATMTANKADIDLIQSSFQFDAKAAYVPPSMNVRLAGIGIIVVMIVVGIILYAIHASRRKQQPPALPGPFQ